MTVLDKSVIGRAFRTGYINLNTDNVFKSWEQKLYVLSYYVRSNGLCAFFFIILNTATQT